MAMSLSEPIAILDEHPQWSARLMAELQSRRLPFEKIDHSSHRYDPRDRARRYAVVVNRSSPSSHRRGHGAVLFYTEALLAHYEATGVPVINPLTSYRFEKSKALQAGLFERLGVRYPRTLVVNTAEQLVKAAQDVCFPVLIKPNVGGSGALIERFDSAAELEARAHALDFGPDGTALLQQYVEPRDGAIVRVEILDGRVLYAIRIIRPADHFNLGPADLCAAPAATASPVCAGLPLQISRVEPPADVAEQAVALARAASIDIGGIEYLVGKDDGRVYFYDVNATSNFVADAPAVLGFDPFHDFADYITRRAV